MKYLNNFVQNGLTLVIFTILQNHVFAYSATKFGHCTKVCLHPPDHTTYIWSSKPIPWQVLCRLVPRDLVEESWCCLCCHGKVYHPGCWSCDTPSLFVVWYYSGFLLIISQGIWRYEDNKQIVSCSNNSGDNFFIPLIVFHLVWFYFIFILFVMKLHIKDHQGNQTYVCDLYFEKYIVFILRCCEYMCGHNVSWIS